tara:strand:+ start:2601 stop:2786 length:186 start_codon:yes stop_codon:yes gene_type:complete
MNRLEMLAPEQHTIVLVVEQHTIVLVVEQHTIVLAVEQESIVHTHSGWKILGGLEVGVQAA